MAAIIIILIIMLLVLVLYSPVKNYIGRSESRDLQLAIYKKYSSLISGKKISFNDFCYPKQYSIQPQQIFAGEYMKPPNTKEILIFHKIGAGKTCVSIQIAEKWTALGKPIIVMPASLIPGFRNELRSECAGNKYISPNDRNKLRTISSTSQEYKEIIEKSNAKILSNYQILSYNKFLNDHKNLDAPIIIIDEVQNINNINGKYFRAVNNWIDDHPKSSVVIMSGTPIFDSPEELIGLAKLLRINEDKITPANIKSLFTGKVSYFAGAPKFTYPQSKIIVKQCVMSAFQRKWYSSEVENDFKNIATENIVSYKVSNNFYIKSRQRSNVVYPLGLVGTNGISYMEHAHLTTNLGTYSCKLPVIMRKLTKNQLSFIYTGFTGYGGIKFIEKVLQAHGYNNYAKHGPGNKRYAVWSGDQTDKDKDNIRFIYNSAANDDASQIQVIIGSPSIKEGVTLLRTRQVHILESYWNHSRLEQIFGRAVRYCSHKSLPKKDRDVNIYIYAAVTHKITTIKQMINITPRESIDLYMLRMADMKRDECDKYNRALIDCAVDKYLWTKK